MPKEAITIVVCIILGVAFLFAFVRGNKRRKVIQERIESGTRTKGYIFAVKPDRTTDSYSGIRDINPSRPIALKLSYEAANGIPGQTILTHISRTTPNLHPYIAGAVGISSIGLGGFGLIKKRHQQLKEYREQLLAEGKTEEEVKKATMDAALRMSNAAPGGNTGETDEDGFLLMSQPVPVDVYVSSDERTTIVFNKEETDKFFANQNFFGG